MNLYKQSAAKNRGHVTDFACNIIFYCMYVPSAFPNKLAKTDSMKAAPHRIAGRPGQVWWSAATETARHASDFTRKNCLARSQGLRGRPNYNLFAHARDSEIRIRVDIFRVLDRSLPLYSRICTTLACEATGTVAAVS